MDVMSIVEHRQSGQALLMKGMFDKLPTWQNFIDHMNAMSKNTHDSVGHKGAFNGHVGGINFWHPLTLTIERATKEFFPEINNYMLRIKKMHPNLPSFPFTAISFTTSEPTTQRHTDPSDVFYLQCIGNVIWETTVDDVVTQYHLEPGDLIYVPTGCLHEVKSLTPRAAISFPWKV